MVYRGGGSSTDIFESPFGSGKCSDWCAAYMVAGGLEGRDPYYIKCYDYKIGYPTNRVPFSQDGISLDPQIFQMTLNDPSRCLRMKL